MCTVLIAQSYVWRDAIRNASRVMFINAFLPQSFSSSVDVCMIFSTAYFINPHNALSHEENLDYLQASTLSVVEC